MNQLNYRNDGRIEWICEHDIGHTLFAPNGNYVHGCDGCCNKEEEFRTLKLLIQYVKKRTEDKCGNT